jgi:hypothetical protein
MPHEFLTGLEGGHQEVSPSEIAARMKKFRHKPGRNRNHD